MDDKHIIQKKDLRDILKVAPVAVGEEDHGGIEHAVCVVAVNSVGEIDVISIINYEKAVDYYVDECSDYMDSDFREAPGIYLVEFSVDGSGPDYNGEYDSWSEFGKIIKYKIPIKDKRKERFIEDKYFQNYETKIYDDPGSEYPRILFIVKGCGVGRILDVLNEDKAYKSVIKEIIHGMEDMDKIDGIDCLGLYEADFAVDADMDHIFDRDENEGIKLSNIKRVPLILEDEPLDRPTRQEMQEAEWRAWGRYVEGLREGEDHII